jgi:hypothetical protein
LATDFLSIDGQTAKKPPSSSNIISTNSMSQKGHLSVEAFCGTKILLWNGGEVAAAARVRGDCAVEALLRIEFLVLLVQAKRT